MRRSPEDAYQARIEAGMPEEEALRLYRKEVRQIKARAAYRRGRAKSVRAVHQIGDRLVSVQGLGPLGPLAWGLGQFQTFITEGPSAAAEQALDTVAPDVDLDPQGLAEDAGAAVGTSLGESIRPSLDRVGTGLLLLGGAGLAAVGLFAAVRAGKL